MGLMDYFKPVSAWSVDQVREFLKGRDPADYNLVDVRQPEEYAQVHLPGARLIPLGELTKRMAELNPGKPTIAY